MPPRSAATRSASSSPERIVVAGASAGDGLAAGVALLARDRGGPGCWGRYSCARARRPLPHSQQPGTRGRGGLGRHQQRDRIGFSRARRWMSAAISSASGGRPGPTAV
nr:alpha/beta hydrolase fold domain-containing protein [Streptomyces sp. 5-6(2022)]